MKTKILNSDAAGIQKAAVQIQNGNLVAFPTETVYGLGANARNDRAVASIYEAKRRPNFNPLIVHFENLNNIKEQVVWNKWAEKLAAMFWPGAITLVLSRSKNCTLSQLVSAGLDTVAVRIPSNIIARTLIKKSACPVAAPSANSAGKISPTTAAHVKKSLDTKIPFIINGGSCAIGVESTVINLSDNEPRLLRSGGITLDQIVKVIGPISSDDVGKETILSPGMLKRHYAPDVPIRLNATTFSETENVIGFGPNAPNALFNLSSTSNLVEAAANLFGLMHKLNRPNANPIAVMPIPDIGIGIAINDRLRRAATSE